MLIAWASEGGGYAGLGEWRRPTITRCGTMRHLTVTGTVTGEGAAVGSVPYGAGKRSGTR